MKSKQQSQITQRVLTGANEAIRRLNPGVFGLGAVEAAKPEPAAAPALDGGQRKLKASKGGLARIVITLVAKLHTRMDDDNVSGACKPLRDAIAETLNIDDGDSRVRWEYGQCETRGEEGVIVRIEPIASTQ